MDTPCLACRCMNDQTNILVSLMDVTVYGLEDIFLLHVYGYV